MHRIAEALRERHRRIIGRQLVVGGGFIAVRTPVALVGAAAGIEHDHAAVLIAVGDIEFLRRFVDHHVGGAAKLAGGIRAATAPTGSTSNAIASSPGSIAIGGTTEPVMMICPPRSRSPKAASTSATWRTMSTHLPVLAWGSPVRA